eukprot:gene1616-1788_t
MATESRRLNNRAQLASLQAEVSFLHQHELIASEELRLNRMKEKLKLETQMAKISAQEKVFTDFETRSQISTEDKPFSVPHVSTSIPPLKKTDESHVRWNQWLRSMKQNQVPVRTNLPYQNSWVKKVCDGSQIKPGDGEGLQELADELESCEMILKATKMALLPTCVQS